MKRIWLAGVLALVASSVATAQTSFPSAAPGVRVGGSVMLSCNAAGAACQPVSPASPLAARATGGPSIATGQTSVGTAATLVAAARPGRQTILVSIGAANACVFGPAGVTASTGFSLQPVAGASMTIDTAAELWAACSATTTVSVLEEF